MSELEISRFFSVKKLGFTNTILYLRRNELQKRIL
jgi:hypothetical protein